MNLETWRNEIDGIDTEILNLLQKRAVVVKEIGKIKAKAGLPLIDEEREQAILNRISRRRNEPLSGEAVSCIFSCIIQESRRIQIEALQNSSLKLREKC